MNVKLATFNLKNDNFSAMSTYWSRRKFAIREFFNEEKPDIVGTQELNYDRIQELLALIPEYDYIGEGRAGGKSGEYCAIFYRKDLFECLHEETFWLSKRPEKRNSRGWLAMFPRICTWGRFQEREGEGREVIVLNTHLDVLSPYARRDGLLQIAKFVRKNYPDDAVALMGDFNAKPGSLALRVIEDTNRDSGLFSDSSYSVFFSLESPNGRTYHGFHGNPAGLPIDYIFVSKYLKIQEASVIQRRYLGKYPSDHFPICMDCTLD